MDRETILILDTDKNITWTLGTLLENEKYLVVTTDSIDRATRNFSEFQVSGFITEYWIQNVCTLEVIRKLKEICPESYVMMITDKEIKEDEYEDILQCGVDDCFLKPIPINRILLHLRKGLRYRGLLMKREQTKEAAPFDSEGEEIGIRKGQENLQT